MTLTMLKLPGPSPHHTEMEHLDSGHKQPKLIKGFESPHSSSRQGSQGREWPA